MRSVLSAVLLVACLFGLTSVANAKPKYAQAEAKPCVYCHVAPNGGGARNYRGIYYANNKNTFAQFDDVLEAKKANVPVAPEALPPPKSLQPIQPKLPPDTENLSSLSDFAVASIAGIEMVKIPAGSFQRGTTDLQRTELEKGGAWKRMNRDETPARTIRISKPFLISKTEITQAQWNTVMATASPELAKNPSAFKGDNLPVDSVTWDAAKVFCGELNKRYAGKARFRLPTEAEWEYIARAGSAGIYSHPNEKILLTVAALNEYAWFSPLAQGKTHPVATRKPNAFGLYDTMGNVWEWCEDAYGSEFYRSSPDIDPMNRPIVVSERVLRGGCYFLDERALRPALRGGNLPTVKSPYFGFRIVREL